MSDVKSSVAGIQPEVIPASVDAVAEAPSTVRAYYELTKPGITQMVAMTTLTGYYLALPVDVLVFSSSAANWLHFLATMVGTVFISAGSCVVNQIVERDSDARMKRTASRPIPAGVISVSAAAMFGAILSVLGVALLATTNVLTVSLAVVTWLVYTMMYTPIKKRSPVAMLIGGIPGALPFAGGWTAVSGSLDVPAIVLFGILFFWQMPHFLALSWMYRQDYRQGGYALRALSDDTGKSIGKQMIGYSLLLLGVLMLPTVIGFTGAVYLVSAMLLGGWLVGESLRYMRHRDVVAARRVLLTSYAVLMGTLVMMVIDKAAHL